ncbi:MAG TPA: histidine kinase [Firmicutes bacterium]|jgi:two-component system, sensor histidine kinase ChiS|nr:histidine kinase [Bacillota bacterium]
MIMMKTNANKRIVLLLSCVIITGFIFTGIFILLQPGKGRIYPVNGRLDLKNWNPERDGIVTLSGGWDFYWKKLLTYQDFGRNRKPDLRVKAPAVWNKYRIRGKRLPGFGWATYRLQVADVPEGKPLALRIPTFSAAYRLYVNSKLVAANGEVSSNSKLFAPQYRPRIVEFTPPGTSFELIVQVANFSYARGGMWYRMTMGAPEQIWKRYRDTADKDLLLIGALAVMALYYLGIFLLRPESKSSLYFALICLMFMSRTAVFGDYFLYRLPPAAGYHAVITLACITLVWFPILILLFIDQLFPEETSKKALKGFLAYSVLMAGMFLLTPIGSYTRLIYPVEAAAAAAYIYAIVCLMKAFMDRKKDAMLALIGTLALILSAARVMLYQNNIILSNYGFLVQAGLLTLLVLQSFILARRFSTAFRDVEGLTQKLLKLDQIKDEFLANTSHELRTPLSGILGITEATLRGSEGELNNGQKQNLSMIAASSRRLAILINDILDYSKLKHGDIRLNIKPVRLDGLIQTVAKVFQQLSQTKDYEVICELPVGLPLALADENRVIQILYNLMGNAVKFTNRGYIKVAARRNGAMLEVCVSDTGEGIAADKLEEIFKSFEQLDTSLTRKQGGTGLGLSITKQLVELQGGSIRVESKLGAGSAFYFTLPLADVPKNENPDGLRVEEKLNTDLPVNTGARELAAAALGEQPVKFKKTSSGAGTQVLVVDDDALNLHSLGAILKISGYSVTMIDSGKAALEELGGRHQYSLVILDVMMPEMSGYEVCRRLRESKSNFDLPVLMLTAKTTAEDIVAGFEAGANDYLPKPFEPEELLARVRTLVNLKKSVDKAIGAELAFMQAQIKPHFLYNTLNTISSFCETAPEQARLLIDEFANYLRQSFDFRNLEMYVPIKNEISLTKSYVEIEKARFGSKLSVEFDIEETRGVKIPPLSIQPLVENAIRHGIRKKGGHGTVRIAVKNTGEGVLVSVVDDGSGILPERLAKIYTDDAGQGIGLWNIDFRLKKLLGQGLSIESQPGKGTRVMFLIPREGGE